MVRLAALLVSLLHVSGAAAQSSDDTAAWGPLPRMREHRIEEPVFNGTAWVYEAGAGKPRTIVLIHGIGQDGARDFREVVPWLSEQYHVITFDLPGFGRSSKANVPYSPENYAAFVKFVADKYVHGPFTLLGHSMGGVVALRYAATYPGDVERLIVADTPGILYRLSFTSQYFAHLGLDFVPPVMNPQQKLAGFARRLLGHAERVNLDPEVVLASPSLRETVLGGDPARIAGLALVLDDLSKALPKIEPPTLVIWGGDDTLAPLRTGKLLAATIPHARLVVLDKTGHTPMTDSPDAFRAALEPFLHGDPVGAPVPALAAGPKQGDVQGCTNPGARGTSGCAARDVRCERQRNMVFEGDYDTLVITSCPGARIRNARIGQLRILYTTVEIENSDIGGGRIGLNALDSTVIVTGGRIEGETAINALESRIDLAGVTVHGTRAAVAAPVTSSVVFSVSRVDSPRTRGDMQGYYVVEPGAPL